MATYYFVVAEDDMWWVRVRGRTYGGFLMRSHAVKQAVHSARKCRGEAHVVVQEPQFRWRIEWSSLGEASESQALDQAMPPIMVEPAPQDGLAAG
ncbi:hypothetical protein [Ferrovibrio sp.]|uniref:hypothetical protein n=1 Tax=Ferrovibrio sp. TaxID=1917215 RepID=UPI000CC9743C|nr:hypothetical protein [Ferrovibrio sp.]PJI40199.1 MAG: hypothetical protein CTR53_11025 [Ferrovibrio sp.]